MARLKLKRGISPEHLSRETVYDVFGTSASAEDLKLTQLLLAHRMRGVTNQQIRQLIVALNRHNVRRG